MSAKTSQFSGKYKGASTWVSRLQERVGYTVYERFMVYKKPEAKKTRNGSYLVTIEIGDKTGRVCLKIWQVPQYEVDKVFEWFELENVYAIEATVREFNGQTELHITWQADNKNKPWQCVSSLDEKTTDYFESDFCEIPTDWTQKSVQEMKSYVENVIFAMPHASYRRILKSLWENESWQEKFCLWPAAKWHHHAYYHGLLQHVYEMLLFGEIVSLQYPKINLSLLQTAIIVHDMGKLQEYVLGMQIGYNDKAFLLGHMVIAIRQIEQLIQEQQIDIEKEDLENLYHLILSHHGEIELGQGSAVSPKLVEAKLLYQLDVLSAKTNAEFLKQKRDKR